MNTLVDMHFHLDFAAEPAALASKLGSRGVGMLAVSCDVPGYLRAHEAVEAVTAASLKRSDPSAASAPDNSSSNSFAAAPFSRAAIGLHPWWVARGVVDETMVSEFERLAPDASAFGELGLDFNDRHAAADSHESQLAVFERACAAASASARAAGIRKPLSIHSVATADEALDILESTGCLEYCSCIFHWFSGSLPQLERAREAGCWFSFNEMGLRTGKGREYAKLIPADRLLLETDLPPENTQDTGSSANPTSTVGTSAATGSSAAVSSSAAANTNATADLADSVAASLERALDLLAQARGAGAESLRGLTTANACQLLEHSA